MILFTVNFDICVRLIQWDKHRFQCFISVYYNLIIKVNNSMDYTYVI